jgi:hypothetical protein
MKHILFSILLMLVTAVASAQTRINVDFPELAAKADETVDVTLDGPMLRFAGKFLSDDGDERTAKDVIRNLVGIYVRSYSFQHEGEYDRAIADRVRSQLGPSWHKIVKVTSRHSDNVDIYADMRGEAVQGLVIISAEPKEFTVVNLVGPVDLDKLGSLEGQFGIPRMTAENGRHK